MNAHDGAVALVLGHDVMGFRVDGDARQVFVAGADFAGERVDLTQRVDLVAPHFDAIGVIFIRGINLDHVAANAEGTAAQVFAALVLDVDEAAQESFARSLVALFEHDQHAIVSFRRTEAVDAGDRSDNDDVTALEERTRGAHAQLVKLIVDSCFFIDIKICRRDIGFGLVIIVVADEILDGVFRKKRFELVIELCRQRFVVGENQ